MRIAWFAVYMKFFAILSIAVVGAMAATVPQQKDPRVAALEAIFQHAEKNGIEKRGICADVWCNTGMLHCIDRMTRYMCLNAHCDCKNTDNN